MMTLAVSAVIVSSGESVFCQRPATSSKPWPPARLSDGQPDVQGGRWTADTNEYFGGTGSLENPNRTNLLFQIPGSQIQKQPSRIVDPPDGRIPYQPWAAAKRPEFFANSVTPTKREQIDPNTRGFLTGVPRIQHYPPPMQILQVPGSVVLLYENKHASRVIPLDGRPHVGERITLWMGDSRGRWEGNTLVVDVTNQTDRTWLDVLSFHGQGLHVVERWTPVGPDRIDYQATFEDSTMFTRPWTIAYSFTRDTRALEIWEQADYEGERDIERILSGGGFAGRKKE